MHDDETPVLRQPQDEAASEYSPAGPEEISAWLHRVLERYANHELDQEQLVAATNEVARCAASERIPPEKLIVAFKLAWSRPLQPGPCSPTPMEARLYALLINACLDGYFGK